MKIRELLRYEIWSKRTTRKIVVILGIVCCVLVVGFSSLYLAETRWITPGERSAGKVALVQIDTLETLNSTTDEEFDKRDKRAQEQVEAARKAASTIRDKRIADGLYAYLAGVETDRSTAKMRESMQQRHSPVTDFERKLDLSGIQATQFVRSVLHRALD